MISLRLLMAVSFMTAVFGQTLDYQFRPIPGAAHAADGGPLIPDLGPNLERPEDGQQTVSVAELQHPLSRKGRSALMKAQADLSKGDVPTCFRDLEKAMKVNSAMPYVHGVKGAAYLVEGRLENAISELQEAVTVLPIAANLSNLGLAYLMHGDQEQGEDLLKRAVASHNAPLQTRFLMGLAMLDHKPQVAEACEQLRRTQNLMPAAHIALAVCYQKDGSEEAVNRQIRDVVGPANEPRFELRKRWVALVAAAPKPSAAFGLRVKQAPSTPQ